MEDDGIEMISDCELINNLLKRRVLFANQDDNFVKKVIIKAIH